MSGAVGFIGLGNIGAPMARRLLGWPGGLVVHDVVSAACEPFVEAGATMAATPSEVAASAGVICVMVQSEEQVREVLEGPSGIGGAARPGTVVAVHSTISPEGAVALSAVAARHGIDLIDAAVSGGAMGAASGRLAFLVGGSADAVERARPALELMGDLVERFGDVGAGTRAKIARNLITFASYAVVGETLQLATASDLDVAALGRVIRHSDVVTGGPGAVIVRPTAEVMAPDDPLRPIFEHTLSLGTKDLELAIAMGEQAGVPTPFASLAAERLAAAIGLEPPH